MMGVHLTDDEREESLTRRVQEAAPQLWEKFVRACQRERGGEQQIKRGVVTSPGGRTTEVLKVKGVMV